MIKKLPGWIEIGGLCLSGVAGAVNAIGLLGFDHQAVSHLSGTTSLLGLAIADLNGPLSLHLALILLAFLMGAMLSGLIIGSAALRLGRRYSLALIVESVLLFLAWLALDSGSTIGHLLASAACGLQNSLVSTYSGTVVRTTHITGIVTDLGIMLGSRIRGGRLDKRRLLLFCTLLFGFLLGGVGGAFFFRKLGFGALLIPVAATLLLAGLYLGYYYRKRTANSSEASSTQEL